MARLKRETRTRKQIREVFLLKLEETANVTEACRLAKVARRTIYNWLKTDEAFKVEYKKSADIAIDMLEDEARRRAFKGNKKPVYQGGKKVGFVQEYSDTLLIFLLKSHRRDIYGDHIRQEHTGKDGEAIKTETTVISNVDYSQLPTEALEAIVKARIKVQD